MFGWRWVQRIRLPLGFRSSMTRNGMGFSWGIPGLRFGISPSGRKWISFGFPRSGLYFFRYLNSNNSQRSTNYGSIIGDDGEVIDDIPRSRVERNENNYSKKKNIKWKNLK